MNETLSITEKEAKKLSEQWNTARLAIKRLEEELTVIESQLRTYVQETGEKNIGAVMAYTRTSPAKLEAKTGTTLAKVELAICEKIDPDYVARKLNVPSIYENWASDADLRTVLTSFGVKPVAGEEKIYFKHV